MYDLCFNPKNSGGGGGGGSDKVMNTQGKLYINVRIKIQFRCWHCGTAS